MKANFNFLYFTEEGEMLYPLEIKGNGAMITLTKGRGFDEWRADETHIADGKSRREMDEDTLRRLLIAWLDGAEFEG